MPISEVGSIAAGLGWKMACAAKFAKRPAGWDRVAAAMGVMAGAGLVVMKLVPAVPGHFTRWEFVALGVWLVFGALLHRRAAAAEVPR